MEDEKSGTQTKPSEEMDSSNGLVLHAESVQNKNYGWTKEVR